MKNLIFILLAVLCVDVTASYRVYELKLEYFDARGKKERERVEISTLDALQYEHYHGGYGNLKAQLVDTWYCPGDTSRKQYCKKPTSSPTRGPASTEEKRGQLPYNRQPVIP